MNWNFFLAPSPLKWGHLKLMKKILVILLSFLPLITSKADVKQRLIIVWTPSNGYESRMFYPDSISIGKKDRINLYVNGKIYNVDSNCIDILNN